MSDNGSKQTKAYQKLLDNFSDYVQQSEKIQVAKLYELIDTSKKMWHAAGEMTKDEAELIATYARRDLSSFLLSWRDEKKALREWFKISQLENNFYKTLANSSDQTQLEWHELAEDFRHHGVYHTGEVVGHGEFSCTACGHSLTVHGPTKLTVCQHCGAKTFNRHGFAP